jgi:hypothetical protein
LFFKKINILLSIINLIIRVGEDFRELFKFLRILKLINLIKPLMLNSFDFLFLILTSRSKFFP